MTNTRIARVSAARAGGKVLLLSMLSRLIDTATISRPGAPRRPGYRSEERRPRGGAISAIEAPLHERDPPHNLKLSRPAAARWRPGTVVMAVGSCARQPPRP